MSTIRASITRLFAVARGETRLALTGAPEFAWRLVGVAVWASIAVLAGLIVGFAAVALPPLGLAGIIVPFILFLLWVVPDGFNPPEKLIRRMLLIVLFADICLPTYYSVQFPGSPWISIRRIFTFALIVLFAITFSASRPARQRIFDVIKDNPMIFVGVFGYIFMANISLFTALSTVSSLSALIDTYLEWYVPFFCAMYVLRDVEDVEMMVRFLCWCCIIITLAGVADFMMQKSIYISVMPQFMYDNLIATSDYARSQLQANLSHRMGQVRVNGPYTVSLSFAEGEAMFAPFGAVLLLHGRSLWDRMFGSTVLVASLVGIYVSGSRGGYLSFLVGIFLLGSMMVVRSRLLLPRSLAAPVFAILAGAGFVVTALAIMFVGRIHNLIFASGEGASSTAARFLQWKLAWPKILANPVTGYGLANSGPLIGYRAAPDSPLSVDSFVLSLITETGVPGMIFYFATCFSAVFTGMRQYLVDPGRGGVWAGGLAASIGGYTFYRFALSQRENQTLFFIMIGCVALLNHCYLKERAARATAS